MNTNEIVIDEKDVFDNQFKDLSEFSETHLGLKWRVIFSKELFEKMNEDLCRNTDKDIVSIILHCRIRQVVTCCHKALIECPINVNVSKLETTIDGCKYSFCINYYVIENNHAMCISIISSTEDMVVNAEGDHFLCSPTNQQLALAFIVYQGEETGCVELLTSRIEESPQYESGLFYSYFDGEKSRGGLRPITEKNSHIFLGGQPIEDLLPQKSVALMKKLLRKEIDGLCIEYV